MMGALQNSKNNKKHEKKILPKQDSRISLFTRMVALMQHAVSIPCLSSLLELLFWL